MANKTAKRVKETGMGPASRRTFLFNMFGDLGIEDASDVGSWINVENTQWKGFQIQPRDNGGSIGGVTTVFIEGAFRLNDEADPFSAADDAYQIGTLDNANRYASIESPIRWVRARTTAFGGTPCTVGMHALS